MPISFFRLRTLSALFLSILLALSSRYGHKKMPEPL